MGLIRSLGEWRRPLPAQEPPELRRLRRGCGEALRSSGTFWASHPDLPKVPLGAVELWNEPFGGWFWKPTPDPKAYARLVDAAAPAVHAADASLTVLASGDLIQSRADGVLHEWLGELLDADPTLPAEVDGFSVHPYPWPRDAGPYDPAMNPRVSFGRVSAIRDTELAHGTQLPIWITEIGWSTAPGVSDAVSEATQAQFLTGAIQRATGEWRSFVSRIFVFSWDPASDRPGDREGNYSIRHADGSPKPAWTAIQHLLAQPSS